MRKRCFRCGNEIPESREVVRNGKPYCSLEHARMKGTTGASPIPMQSQPTPAGVAEKPKPSAPQPAPAGPSSPEPQSSAAVPTNQPKPTTPQR